MQAARDKIGDSFLAHSEDYESIADYIVSALASTMAALAEAHHKLYKL